MEKASKHSQRLTVPSPRCQDQVTLHCFSKMHFQKRKRRPDPLPHQRRSRTCDMWRWEIWLQLVTISKQLDNLQRTTKKTEALVSLEVGNIQLTRQKSEHRTVTKPWGGELTPSTQKSCIAWRPQQLKWTEYATLRSWSHLSFLIFLLFLARSGCTMQLWLWKTTTSFLLVDNSDTTATRGGKLWKVRMET